jgi:hypothetical protein
MGFVFDLLLSEEKTYVSHIERGFGVGEDVSCL